MRHESGNAEERKKSRVRSGLSGALGREWTRLDETILRVFLLRFLSVWVPLENLRERRQFESLARGGAGKRNEKRTKCL